MLEYGLRRRVDAEFCHDLGRGALDSLSADQWAHDDHGNAARAQGLAHRGDRQYRVDAEVGIRRAHDDGFERIAAERLEHSRSRQGRRGAFVTNRAHARAAAPLDEILLKSEIAGVGVKAGFDARVAHRQDGSGYAEASPEVVDNRRQRCAFAHFERPDDVKGQVAVAQPEPGFRA